MIIFCESNSFVVNYGDHLKWDNLHIIMIIAFTFKNNKMTRIILYVNVIKLYQYRFEINLHQKTFHKELSFTRVSSHSFNWSINPGFGFIHALACFTIWNASFTPTERCFITYAIAIVAQRDTPALQWTKTVACFSWQLSMYVIQSGIWLMILYPGSSYIGRNL